MSSAVGPDAHRPPQNGASDSGHGERHTNGKKVDVENSPPNETSWYIPNIRTWLSKEHWKERLITFDPSWYTVCMGIGICIQLLTNLPYPAHWLHTLAYCFWILDIVVFSSFLMMSLLRLVLYPGISKNILSDFSQTSYLGTIPIALDTITTGIVVFYSSHPRAIYTSEALFWICVIGSVAVGFGGIFVMYAHQGEHQLSDVNGSWLLTFIPLIVTSALGSSLAPYLGRENSITVLAVSFLMWSLGVSMSIMILTIYFWRLMSCHLPPRPAIISTFVPVGPLGMGAYSIQNLAVGLATHIDQNRFVLQRAPLPPSQSASLAIVAEGVHWSGIIVALLLLGLATFWLVEAFASVWTRLPKAFSIGFWSFVFPVGVYANAWCIMSTDLRNNAMKGWAATTVVFTLLLFLGCALTTFYRGVWRGKLFFAPGLQGWMEQKYIEEMEHKDPPTAKLEREKTEEFYRKASGRRGEEDSNVVRRHCSADGSYNFSSAKRRLASRHGEDV